MEDWQIAVLNSGNLRVDQDEHTGYRLVIRRTNEKNRMSIPEIVATIRHAKRKPVIMRPEDPFRGTFAEKREVLEVLMRMVTFEEKLAELGRLGATSLLPCPLFGTVFSIRGLYLPSSAE